MYVFCFINQGRETEENINYTAISQPLCKYIQSEKGEIQMVRTEWSISLKSSKYLSFTLRTEIINVFKKKKKKE